jgi:hypothetical protein
MKKQTAVEWLKKQLDFLEDDMTANDIKWLFGKAEAMEKGQILNAWYDCKLSIVDKKPMDAEEYYEETYGGDK